MGGGGSSLHPACTLNILARTKYDWIGVVSLLNFLNTEVLENYLWGFTDFYFFFVV